MLETATNRQGQTGEPELPGPLERIIRAPGAVVVRRGGAPVVAHYGSVAAELAVCTKAVGLAVRPDLQSVELVGADPWLEVLLEKTLDTDAPAVGRVLGSVEAWCARLDDDRALVVGGTGPVARWRRVTREAAMAGSRVIAGDGPTAHLSVCLVGPRVPDLLRVAGLPGPVRTGFVRTCQLAGDLAIVIGESERRALLLFTPERATAACAALLHAGRSVGASLVGADALARLGASGRMPGASVTSRGR